MLSEIREHLEDWRVGITTEMLAQLTISGIADNFQAHFTVQEMKLEKWCKLINYEIHLYKFMHSISIIKFLYLIVLIFNKYKIISLALFSDICIIFTGLETGFNKYMY